jgi:3-isopropylmalate dehydrogenase
MTLSRDLMLSTQRDFGTELPLSILAGEGIGPEIIRACEPVMAAIESHTPYRFDRQYGGEIGKRALQKFGSALTSEVIDFCAQGFARGAPLLCGPGGDRFVYELRRTFDIFCKFVPLQPMPALRDTGVLRSDAVRDVDILVLRENVGGLYQGEWQMEDTPQGQRAHQRFHYDESQVRRLMALAIAASTRRRGRLCVVHKPGGAPAISELWVRIAREEASGSGVDLRFLEVDTAAYLVLAEAREFDVMVAPNMFGDVLGDAAALLLGSRGMSYSFNVADNGAAVYQTAHGAAYDLAGSQRANPLGQVQTLAALLAESFGLENLASAVLQACDNVLAGGTRTADIAASGCQVVATQAMGEAVGEELARLLDARSDTALSAG